MIVHDDDADALALFDMAARDLATMTAFDHADHETISSQPAFAALLGGTRP